MPSFFSSRFKRFFAEYSHDGSVHMSFIIILALPNIILFGLLLGGCNSTLPGIPGLWIVQFGAVRVGYLGICVSAKGELTCAGRSKWNDIARGDKDVTLGKALAKYVFPFYILAITLVVFLIGVGFAIIHNRRQRVQKAPTWFDHSTKGLLATATFLALFDFIKTIWASAAFRGMIEEIGGGNSVLWINPTLLTLHLFVIILSIIQLLLFFFFNRKTTERYVLAVRSSFNGVHEVGNASFCPKSYAGHMSHFSSATLDSARDVFVATGSYNLEMTVPLAFGLFAVLDLGF